MKKVTPLPFPSSLAVPLSGMTPYETAEWHSHPDPHHPHPPSLVHHPLSPLANSAYIQHPELLPLFSPNQTEKGDWECTLLFTAPLPPSFPLSPVLTPLLPSLTPSPSFGFGEAAIRPCPSLLTNRQTRKQSENRHRQQRVTADLTGKERENYIF